MRREIRFRGLRTDGKGWVYGSYIEFKGESDIMVFFDTTSKRKHEYKHIFLDKHLIAETIMPDEQGWDYGSQIRFHEVILESVGQFTGLHDKSGVEIYEGDVIGYYGSDKGQEIRYSNDGRLIWKNPYGDFTVNVIEIHDPLQIEIIGNIHEK